MATVTPLSAHLNGNTPASPAPTGDYSRPWPEQELPPAELRRLRKKAKASAFAKWGDYEARGLLGHIEQLQTLIGRLERDLQVAQTALNNRGTPNPTVVEDWATGTRHFAEAGK